MTLAMERVDSEIRLVSHWAIMTRAMERADSEIRLVSYWAIMTRAMERADSEIRLVSHWAIMTAYTGKKIHFNDYRFPRVFCPQSSSIPRREGLIYDLGFLTSKHVSKALRQWTKTLLEFYIT